jgi:fatty-acid desaturase
MASNSPVRSPAGLRVSLIIATAVIHCSAGFAPFYVLPIGIFVFSSGIVLIGLFGVTLGYHRYLTHRSFSVSPTVRRVLLTLGTLALEGGPVTWVAVHRLHHRFADTSQDPHSPRDGLLRAHIYWGLRRQRCFSREVQERYARDVLSDPFAVFLERHNVCINLVFNCGLAAAAGLLSGREVAASVWTWSMLRIVYVWHATYLVNSICHRLGRRSHTTKDDSCNNLLVALLSFGEGWHNNHHHNPRSAAHGIRWWQIDFTYYVIIAMYVLGLARDIHGRRAG